MTVGQVVIRKMAEAQRNAVRNRQAGRAREAAYWIGAAIGAVGIAVELNRLGRITATEFSRAGKKYSAAMTLWAVMRSASPNPGRRSGLDAATVRAFENFLTQAGVA